MYFLLNLKFRIMKKLVFLFSGVILSLMLIAQLDNFSQVIYVVDSAGIHQALNVFNDSKLPGYQLSIAPEAYDYYYFDFVKQPDGYYYIINANSGLYLEPQSSPAYSGCKIVQNAPKGDDNQKWRILPGRYMNGWQSYFIMPKSNDELYITIKGASVVLAKFSLNQDVETQTWTFFDCFPESVFVLTESGNVPINEISKGDYVASWNIVSSVMEFSQVDTVLLHNVKDYSLTRISFVNHNMLYATTNEYFNIEIIDATENHPLLTPEGYKPIGEICEGDIILYYSDYSQVLDECIVVRVQKNYYSVAEVYNIKLANGMPYIVNHTIASPKCPYISIMHDNKLTELSEVLRNQLSYYLDKYEQITIPHKNISGNILNIKIDERKDEISYIDHVYLIADDEIYFPLDFDLTTEISKSDNKYLKLNKGKEINLQFELRKPVSDYAVVKLAVKGYYDLLN